MPSVILDDPYSLAAFTTTIPANLDRHLRHVACVAADLSPASSAMSDVEGAAESNLVAVTVQGEGVDLYNTTDQKCVKSWSTPPNLTFACSAKYHTKNTSRHVYAVVASGSDVLPKEEGRVVWMWHDKDNKDIAPGTEDENGLAKKTVKKFDRKIFSLQVSPILSSHIILINHDGSISLVSDDLKHVACTCEPSISKQTVLWSTLFVTTSSGSLVPASVLPTSSTIVVTVTGSKTETTPCALTLFYVDAERRSIDILGGVEIEIKGEDPKSAIPLAFSLDPSTGQFSVLSAAGLWTIHQLRFTPTPDHGTRMTLTESLALPLQGFAFGAADTRRGAVAVALVRDGYLALVGARKRGSSDILDHVLTIWDIRYGTLQAERTISAATVGDEVDGAWVAGCTYSLTSIPNSHLVLALTVPTQSTRRSGAVTARTALLLCPYYCPPVSLLGAVGRMRGTEEYLDVGGREGGGGVGIVRSGMEAVGKNLPYEPYSPDTIRDVWAKQLAAAQLAEEEILARLLDPAITPSAGEFSQAFFEHVEKVTREEKEMEEGEAPNRMEEKQEKVKGASDMDVDTKGDASRLKGAKKANGKKKKEKKMEKEKEEGGEGEEEGEGKEKRKKKGKKKENAEEKAKIMAEKKDKKNKKKKAKRREAHEAEEQVNKRSIGEDEDGEGKESELKENEETREAEEPANKRSIDEDEDGEGKESELKENEEAREAEEQANKRSIDEDEDGEGKESGLKENEDGEGKENEENEKEKLEEMVVTNKPKRGKKVGEKLPPLPDLSHNFVLRVTQRCFAQLQTGSADPSFWPVNVVKYLITNEFMNNACVEGGIVKALVERGEWPTLELALKHLHDIPEPDLVFLLRHARALATGTPDNSPSRSFQRVLALVVSAPRNDLFMQQALYKLESEDLVASVETLTKWFELWEEMESVEFEGMNLEQIKMMKEVPAFKVILDYLTLLLDAHFPTLILTPTLHPLLASLSAHVQAELAVCDCAQELRGALGLFKRRMRGHIKEVKHQGTKNVSQEKTAVTKKKKKNLEGGQGLPDYAVEVIHL